MEEIVKMQIQKLRKNGMGLRTIAKYTKQPITSIRYYADKVTPPDIHVILMTADLSEEEDKN